MRAPTVLTGLALGTGLLLAGPGVALAEGPLPAGRVITEPAPVTPAPATGAPEQDGGTSEPVGPESPTALVIPVIPVTPVVPAPPVTVPSVPATVVPAPRAPVPSAAPTPPSSGRPATVQPAPASPMPEPRRTAATPSTDVPAPSAEPSTVGSPPPGAASVLPPQPMLLDRVVAEESVEPPAVTPAIPAAPAPATTTTTAPEPARAGASAPAVLDDAAAGTTIDGTMAQGEIRTAGAFSLRYIAAGILGVVALGLAVAVGATLQPRRIRRTH